MSDLSDALIASVRRISAERADETEAWAAERDSYRESLQTALAMLAEANAARDRERAARLRLLTQYRSLVSRQAHLDVCHAAGERGPISKTQAAA